MRCLDVDHVLSLEDASLAPDVRALGDHLDACTTCRERYSDIVPLVRARGRGPAAGPLPIVRWPSRWPLLALAASAVLLLAPSSSDLAAAEPAEEAPVVLPTTTSLTVHSDGVRSTFTRSVWTPPRPRCLDPETQ